MCVQAPRLGRVASSYPKPSRTLPSLSVHPKKLGGAPSGSCSVSVPSILRGCWCQAAQWCRALGRGHGVRVQDVFCPSPKATSSCECGVPGFGGPSLCSAPLLPPLLGWETEAVWLQGSRQEGPAAVGQVEPPAPLPRGPEQDWAVLVLGLVLSLEKHPHICLQLLCGFSLAPAGFAHLRQHGEMPQSRSPPHKAHAFQPEHRLSLLCLAGPAPAPPARRPRPGNPKNSRLAGEGQACAHPAAGQP